jgi:hypothetical protein
MGDRFPKKRAAFSESSKPFNGRKERLEPCMRTAVYWCRCAYPEGTKGYGAVRGALAVVWLLVIYSIMDRF